MSAKGPTPAERQADAMERVADGLGSLQCQVERLERAVKAGDVRVGHRSELKPLQVLAVPDVVASPFGRGILSQFRIEVPASHVEGNVVHCACGTDTEVAGASVVECVGECGRFFLRVRGVVRCAKYPVEWVRDAAEPVVETAA